MRFFNTAGPCHPAQHYMLPTEPRLPRVREHIDRSHFFVVHAPRQTGKTTAIRCMAHELTGEGKYAALYLSCEHAEVAGDDYGAVGAALLDTIRQEAEYELPVELRPTDWPDVVPERRLVMGLREWSEHCPRPIVLFFDEIDALRGNGLLSVLRQLRDGHNSRPKPFPHSVVLCGLRDVRDYKAASGGDPTRLGTASPFNVKVESIRLKDFTADDVRALYGQHTADTGQVFSDAALDSAFNCTQGQPWLVNALATEVVDRMRITGPISAEHIDEAKERLIIARATHLDSLVAKLDEPRVRRVIEPLVTGDFPVSDMVYDDDLAYVRDLGLITNTGAAAIANPIYREVIVRVLGTRIEANIDTDPRSFVLSDGRFDFARMLREFIAFWREHGDILVRGTMYHEAAPQLVLMAYLQRVVNGGGYIDREYGVGRGRIDLVIRWPYRDADGKRVWQREAVEIKVWRQGRPDPLSQGLTQLDDYLTRLDLGMGTLVIFDRRPEAEPLPDRTQVTAQRTPTGREVTLLRA